MAQTSVADDADEDPWDEFVSLAFRRSAVKLKEIITYTMYCIRFNFTFLFLYSTEITLLCNIHT